MLVRSLQETIAKSFGLGKVIVVIGARQVGKTTLLHQFVDASTSKTLWINCDLQEMRNLFSNPILGNLQLLVADNEIVVIDEAQRIENIGLILKILVENFPKVQFLVTGSSALDLHNYLDEPLTGRKAQYQLYPISTAEIYANKGLLEVQQTIEKRLIYGSYPDILYGKMPPQDTLSWLTENYLFKDVLEVEGIRKSTIMQKLVIALATQIGSEVSYNELSKILQIDSKTVEKYIDLLEKCFIVFRLNSFSRNIRSELNKSKKIYFYDVGIRNAVLNNFSPLELRGDKGALWENFFIVERMKQNHYAGRRVRSYFWRTTDRQEIDYVEEENGEIRLFEMKWNEHQKVRFPNSFIQAYHPTTQHVVTPSNYYSILLQ